MQKASAGYWLVDQLPCRPITSVPVPPFEDPVEPEELPFGPPELFELLEQLHVRHTAIATSATLAALAPPIRHGLTLARMAAPWSLVKTRWALTARLVSRFVGVETRTTR
jgi:hypothetical protein